jgi:hypothetical protein
MSVSTLSPGSHARSRSGFEWVARGGYAARGVVFLIMGYFAILAALGAGRSVSSTDALKTLLSGPMGSVLLAIVAVGLFCFGLWRVMQSVFDADHLGRGGKGLRRRLGYGFGALFHFGLGAWAVSLMVGWSSRGRDGDRPVRDWTAWLMAQPYGKWIVAAVGLGIVIGGIAIVVRAFTDDFERQLDLGSEPSWWMALLARFGFAARAGVYLLVGGFLVVAAWHANSREAKGLGGALQSLREQPYGWILLGILALGLLAFAAYQFVQAWCRRVDASCADDAVDAVREAAK